MASSTLRHGLSDGGPRLAALWFGLLAGPAAWAALLETNFVLSYVACEVRHTWMLHLATGIALGIVALAALVTWRAAPPPPSGSDPAAGATDLAVIRARFMAIGGLALCAWFAIVILATEIPVLVLNPCTP